jgi:hypothetical protein
VLSQHDFFLSILRKGNPEVLLTYYNDDWIDMCGNSKKNEGLLLLEKIENVEQHGEITLGKLKHL